MFTNQIAEVSSILETLMTRKGQIATLTTSRPLKVRKNEQPIIKTSTFQCRIGVDYDNIAVVQDKRETGELPKENAGLPWGQWEVFPYVIEHKGERYFRCTSIRNNYVPKISYFRDGIEISADEAARAALASEFRTESADVFNIKVSSIVAMA